MKIIEKYNTQGIWTTEHRFCYSWAYRELDLFMASLIELSKKEKEVRVNNSKENPEILESLIKHEIFNLENEAYMHATTSHLYLCMSIEGFLNFYGTKRLSKEYYKKNLERMGITEKLPNIFLSCCQIVIEPNDPIIQKLRKLFDRRNRIVHPKSNKITPDKMHDYVVEQLDENDIKDHFKDGEYIIDKICSFDPLINKKFEFKKNLNLAIRFIEQVNRRAVGFRLNSENYMENFNIKKNLLSMIAAICVIFTVGCSDDSSKEGMQRLRWQVEPHFDAEKTDIKVDLGTISEPKEVIKHLTLRLNSLKSKYPEFDEYEISKTITCDSLTVRYRNRVKSDRVEFIPQFSKQH